VEAHKFFRPGAVAPFSRVAWPRPRAGAPGDWVEASAPLSLCRHGVHACRTRDLPFWIAEELWRVELDGDVLEGRDTVVASRGRLLERVEAWDAVRARAFAEDCASRARDEAVSELRVSALDGAADALARAEGLTELVAAGRAAWRAAEEAGADRARAVAFAAMTTAEHAAAGPETPAYVSWAAFAGYGAAVAAGLRTPRGESAERARQAAWLATELALES
jgi:hypothetical protein